MSKGLLRGIGIVIISISISACGWFGGGKKTNPEMRTPDITARHHKKPAPPKEPEVIQPVTSLEPQPLQTQEHSHKSPHGMARHGAGWSYEGHLGPHFWSELKSDFSICKTGQHQSPIDLKWVKKSRQRHPIEIRYKLSSAHIVDNGHTVKIEVGGGNYLVINGKPYELLQFHFHSSSEHKLSGLSHPMEAHFVHKNLKGELAVLGVMIKEGSNNTLVDHIWKHIPKNKHQAIPLGKKLPFNWINSCLSL